MALARTLPWVDVIYHPVLWSPDFPRGFPRDCLGALFSFLLYTKEFALLILLPPSEGKTAAETGAPVDLGDLSFPELTEARERIAEELIRVSAEEDALQQLKVGASLAAEVERNRRILDEPAHPASSVYTGVLFEAFDYSSLDDDAAAAADESVLVVSALWGVVKLTDRIPAYRLSMGVKLGDCGNLATFWKPELARALDPLAQDNLVIDCRSSAYAKAWLPHPERTFAVRVEKETADGARKVVSHMAKHFRGEFARYLVTQGLSQLTDIEEVLVQASHDWNLEVDYPSGKKPGQLTLVIAED